MADRYYDVIVVGRSLGALAAAAMLARRDFTVLVVGQARRPANYGFDGRELRRRAFTMLAASSPVWLGIIHELAQTQKWKQSVHQVSPMLQLLLPGRRFELPPDATLFGTEVEREFPDVRRLVAELYADFARVTAAADAGFSRDAMWPPGTFLERRKTGRVVSGLPYARAEPHADLLAAFPREHCYRRIVGDSVRFATDLATWPPAFAVARLHGAWTRGLQVLDGGEQQLEELLLDRIVANGGKYLMDERVARIEVRRGTVSGVELDGDTSAMGTAFVITDLTGEGVAMLTGGQGIAKSAQREWPRISPTVGRFVVSLVVRSAGVPAPLGREVLILSDSGAVDVAHTIHLQRAPAGQEGETLLIAELLLSERDSLTLQEARAFVLARLCEQLPFLERHLLLVDSVHDGLPLWRYDAASGRRFEVERTALDGATNRIEPMTRQLEVDPPGFLGLGGEPLRGPVDRTLLVGRSVLPGLGQEGVLLAACSAARLVTRSDRRKARMRREMWTKLEIS